MHRPSLPRQQHRDHVGLPPFEAVGLDVARVFGIEEDEEE